MRIKDEFRLEELAQARAIVREHPFGTVITASFEVTRMPFLVEDDPDELVVVGHVADADPARSALGGPLVVVFTGPHGYISASWYEQDTIPTWNHVTLWVRGTPELFEDAMSVLRRTVDHFEAAVEHPWSLDRMGETAREMADQVTAFRLRASSWHAEAKLSQDKPPDERERLIAGLERPGPYTHPVLAGLMRAHKPT